MTYIATILPVVMFDILEDFQVMQQIFPEAESNAASMFSKMLS